MANNENLKPFKKGHDPRRNLDGRPQLIDLKEAIHDEVGDDGIRTVIKALYNKAIKGDVRAIQELLDRGYHKPTQHTDVTTNGKDISPPISWVQSGSDTD